MTGPNETWWNGSAGSAFRDWRSSRNCEANTCCEGRMGLRARSQTALFGMWKIQP